MPHPDRVQPDGTFLATEARGTLTGRQSRRAARRGAPNRARSLEASRLGLLCPVLPRPAPGHHAPRRWTALFFLDDAVALAAGHRPCGERRRAAYRRFIEGWQAGVAPWSGPKAADAQLHVARAFSGAPRLRHETGEAGNLPDGSFVARDGQAFLVTKGRALPHAPEGYGPPGPIPTGPVTILTSPVMRALLAGGYRPALHPSAVRPASPPS